MVVYVACLVCLASGLVGQSTVPVTPTDDGRAVRKLVLVRPFQLEKPHVYTWTQEKPQITSGTILVIQVDPHYARPRQMHMPVLYVGATPAERANMGFGSGFLVVIVPGRPDLTKVPIYFGSVELPERVDARRGEKELAAARALGIHPFPAAGVRAAVDKGGDPLVAKDSADLYRTLSDLILIYAPDETERAEGYRLPK